MARIEQNISIANLFEQGGIYFDDGKDTPSSESTFNKRIKTNDIISLNSHNKLSIAVTSKTGNPLAFSVFVYDINDNFIYTTNAVHNSGVIINLSSQPDAKGVRIVLRYSNGENVTPSDVNDCTMTVFTEIPWEQSLNSYPNLENENFLIDIPTEPYPYSVMIQKENEYPKYHHLNLTDVGAFANATNLRYVRIPESVKKIGEYAFRNTSLTYVTIARDCEYYPTSFPDGCEINFY